MIKMYIYIPDDHYENRPDVAYPKWKNYIHSIRLRVERVEYLGNKMYKFH
jgi:hypothetical protein